MLFLRVMITVAYMFYLRFTVARLYIWQGCVLSHAHTFSGRFQQNTAAFLKGAAAKLKAHTPDCGFVTHNS